MAGNAKSDDSKLDGFKEFLSSAGPLLGKFSGVFKYALDAVQHIADALKKQSEKVDTGSNKGGTGGGGGAGAAEAEELGGALGEVAGVAMAAAAAVAAAIAAVLVFVAATKGWVDALDPGLITSFNLAFRDLEATLGQSFTSIFSTGIAVFEKLAAALDPLMATLKPVIDELSQEVLKNFSVEMKAIIPLLQALMPVVRIISDLLGLEMAVLRPIITVLGLLLHEALTPLSIAFEVLHLVLKPIIDEIEAFTDGISSLGQAVEVIFSSLVETVMGVIQSLLVFSGMKDAVKQITDTFHELVKAIVVTAARIALAIPGDFGRKFVDNLIKNFGEGQGQSAAGATSIKSLEQIGKDLALASINAAGAGEVKDMSNADIVNALKELKSSGKENTDALVNAIGKLPGGNNPVVQGVAGAALAASPAYQIFKSIGGDELLRKYGAGS